VTHTANSYDELPYSCFPQPATHPQRLAVMASLLGLQPPPIARSRILELGCADGTNLISIALSLPNADLLGIDFSARQIERGQARIQQLGLTQVRLWQADLLTVDEQALGEFDYIIAHGLYSWVPPAVQTQILALCAKHLSPQGVAYISYNTRPGWNTRMTMRDMLRYHTSQFAEIPEKIEQMRAWLGFLETHLQKRLSAVSSDQDQQRSDLSYYRYLQSEAPYFQSLHDDYLYHEFLEEFNQPVYFYEFMQQAAAQGLGYAGDAEPLEMFRERKLPELAAVFAGLSTLHHEQYLDFLENRQFRRSLLCHQTELARSRVTNPQLMQQFYYSANLQAQQNPPDFFSGKPEQFENQTILVSENSAIGKGLLWCLARSYPETLSFAALVQQISQHVAWEADRDTPELERLLGHYVMGAAIEAWCEPLPLTANPGAYPVANPLARLQASEGQDSVSTLRNDQVSLNNPILVNLLPYLDGQHSRANLVAILQQWVAEGKITPPQAGPTPVQVTPAMLHGVLDSILRVLAGSSLLRDGD